MEHVIINTLSNGTVLRQVNTGERFIYRSAGTPGGDGILEKVATTGPFKTLPTGDQLSVASLASAKKIDAFDDDAVEVLVLEGFVIDTDYQAERKSVAVDLLRLTFTTSVRLEQDLVRSAFSAIPFTTPMPQGPVAVAGMGYPPLPSDRLGGYIPTPGGAFAGFGGAALLQQINDTTGDPVVMMAKRRVAFRAHNDKNRFFLTLVCPSDDADLWRQKQALKAFLLRLVAHAYETGMCSEVMVTDGALVPSIRVGDTTKSDDEVKF